MADAVAGAEIDGVEPELVEPQRISTVSFFLSQSLILRDMKKSKKGV